jgi:hypothetical protein
MALLEREQSPYTSALAPSRQRHAFLKHAPAQICIDQATLHLIDCRTKVGIV